MNKKIFADQSKYLSWFAEPMLAGLDDSHRALEPVPGNKTAGWILGHLAMTGDFGRRICGRTPICPKEWRTLFAPGTEGVNIPESSYPKMADLIAAFRAVYTDLPDAFASAEESALESQNPFEPARAHFPTVREFVPWLLTGHLGYHVAQLGDWRRAAGLGHKSHI
jgi:hypothetical protein